MSSLESSLLKTSYDNISITIPGWCELRRARDTHTHFLTHTHTHTLHSYFLTLTSSRSVFCTPSCSVDQTGIQTFILLLNEWGTPYFLCNYRFLSGLVSIISQSLLQVQQLLYYSNHGDLFAVWFAVEMYLWMRVGGGSASVCVCVSVYMHKKCAKG